MEENQQQNLYQSIHLGRAPLKEKKQGQITPDGKDAQSNDNDVLQSKLRVEIPENYLEPLGVKTVVDSMKRSSPGRKTEKGTTDLDQVRPEIPMQSSGQYRPVSTAKTYDYADYPGSHQYEELPHTQLTSVQISPDSVDSHSSNGTTVTSGIHSEQEEIDGAVQSADERKRFNPLYDTMINTSPTIYNKVNSTVKAKQDQTLLYQIRLMKIAIILLIPISFSSFAISIYLVASRPDSPKMIEDLRQELKSLQSNYTSMKSKMKSLETVIAGNRSFEYIVNLDEKVSQFEKATTENMSSMTANLDEIKLMVVDIENQVKDRYRNITSVLDLMNEDVQIQLRNISKMEGPQGPQGVGNLSACYMQTYARSSHVSSANTITPLQPTDKVIENYVVMFAACSVQGGEYNNLLFESSVPNRVRYQCKCSGQVTGETQRTCRVHLWLCPRLSFSGS